MHLWSRAGPSRPHQRRRRLAGFTLVELLIVVIILSVLAGIVVPAFGGAGQDARVSTLKANLALLRSAIERYRAEHDGRVPGTVLETDGTTPSANVGACKKAAMAQLTQYSNARGQTSATRSAAFPLGPYVRNGELPPNPFLEGANTRALVCNLNVTDLTEAPTSDGTTGWRLYAATGRLVANDSTVLDGVGTEQF